MPALYIPKPTPARLSPKDGYAVVGPYFTLPTSGTGNFGGTTGETSKEFITVGHVFRLRQSGTITRAKLYVPDLTNLTGFYLKVWRKNSSGTYDLVGTSENLIGTLATGVNTVDLASPIAGVREGDYYGYRLEWDTDGSLNLYASNYTANCTTYYVTNTTPASTNYNWAAQSSSASEVVIEHYMTPPMFVVIGDSLSASSPVHFSFADDQGSTVALNRHWAYLLGKRLNYTYQNMGYNGRDTSELAAVWDADAIALNPRYIIMDGGTVDIATSAVSFSQFLANYRTFFDSCVANKIKCVSVLIPPRTQFNSTQHQTRELWNRYLVGLAQEYPDNVILVDLELYVGQYRTGGDAGNLWDIQSAYDVGDGIHFSEAGLRKWVDAILDTIGFYERGI